MCTTCKGEGFVFAWDKEHWNLTLFSCPCSAGKTRKRKYPEWGLYTGYTLEEPPVFSQVRHAIESKDQSLWRQWNHTYGKERMDCVFENYETQMAKVRRVSTTEVQK